MEAGGSSETMLTFYHTTRLHIPKDYHFKDVNVLDAKEFKICAKCFLSCLSSDNSDNWMKLHEYVWWRAH
jgi:hypothetical protein